MVITTVYFNICKYFLFLILIKDIHGLQGREQLREMNGGDLKKLIKYPCAKIFLSYSKNEGSGGNYSLDLSQHLLIFSYMCPPKILELR